MDAVRVSAHPLESRRNRAIRCVRRELPGPVTRAPRSGQSTAEFQVFFRTVFPPREASRGVRSSVARGSIPYSLVTHPLPLPFMKPGTPSSTVAVQITRVLPSSINTLPSAVEMKSGVIFKGTHLFCCPFRQLSLFLLPSWLTCLRILRCAARLRQSAGNLGGRRSRLSRNLPWLGVHHKCSRQIQMARQRFLLPGP